MVEFNWTCYLCRYIMKPSNNIACADFFFNDNTKLAAVFNPYFSAAVRGLVCFKRRSLPALSYTLYLIATPLHSPKGRTLQISTTITAVASRSCFQSVSV